MPHVQPLRGRVGELHQVVELLPVGQPVEVNLVQAVGLPPGLPLRFVNLRVVIAAHTPAPFSGNENPPAVAEGSASAAVALAG